MKRISRRFAQMYADLNSSFLIRVYPRSSVADFSLAGDIQ